MMKSILYLSFQSFSRYPAYKRAVGTGSSLVGMGCKVYIVLSDTEENRKRYAKECAGCEPIWLPMGGTLSEVWRKLKIIWRIRPDVIYSLSYSLRNLMFLSFAFPRRSKYILEYCELYSSYKRMWGIREIVSLFEADGLVCASRYLVDVFTRRIKKLHRRIPVIYQPYAYPSYLTGSNDVSDRKVIVFMAALWKNYGVYDVIDAFQIVMGSRINVELEIIGSGPEIGRVRQMISDRLLDGCIHVRGFVDEEKLDAYFRHASVFVSPMKDTIQDRARCPSKLFYYIPYNRPIVTCKIGNPYDVLGGCGFYYEHDNVKSMASAIIHALDCVADFKYPDGFVEGHSWRARAKEFLNFVG